MNRHRAEESVETKLQLIAARAKEEKQCKFNNLMHLLNETSLSDCYNRLKKGKASGIDRMTVEQYGQELEGRISELNGNLRKMSWKPSAVRRVYIPKANGGQRPLGIPTVEDKVVQMGITQILEAIYEADFLEQSYGFRKGRNAHQALKEINRIVMNERVGWVIDADIKGFFDNVQHDWMERCLKERISDRKLIKYINRVMKGGVMEEGQFRETETGTPQGGVISPILANIYLHYVLDLWFEKRIKKRQTGYSGMVRYADDFLIFVENEAEAKEILTQLGTRLEKFGLKLSAEKTRLVRMHRKDEQSGKFDFLGFTHYLKKMGRNRYRLSRKMAKQRFAKTLETVKEWMKENRNRYSLEQIWRKLIPKLRGYYNYYGVSDNSITLGVLADRIRQVIYYWLNRRSQRRSFTLETFTLYLRSYPLPKPFICHVLYSYA
ncbi:MAG TPA: group II intron reverse transcriptase/maturase [bacterium]|nr:group II intron reverse transcriptase/maturase [bacterium]HQB10090.1 group II intron reverse transcriptase/maturase [bacterium]HQM84461.1 group II intron reverse transcriptase/maturase [bacterium]